MDIAKYIHDLNQNTTETIQSARNFPAAQLHVSSGNKWNVIQMLEHICLVDKISHAIISRPPDKMVSSSEILGDEKIYKLVVEQKDTSIMTPAILQPQGEIRDLAIFENVFVSQRNELKKDIQTQKFRIDNRVYNHVLLGELTISDWLYFIIRHTQRHINQINHRMQEGTASQKG